METKSVTFEMMYSAMLMLTEALNANTAAILKNGNAPQQPETEEAAPAEPEAEKAKRGRKPKVEAEPEAAPTEDKAEKADEPETDAVTQKDVEAALLEVKGKHGSEAAKKIVIEHGGAETLKKVEPANYQAIIDACEAKMNEAVKSEEADKADESEDADEAAETDITLADLKAKASELAKSMGSPAKAKELIAKYGVTKTDDLDKKHYAALMQDFEAELSKQSDGDF